MTNPDGRAYDGLAVGDEDAGPHAEPVGRLLRAPRPPARRTAAPAASPCTARTAAPCRRLVSHGARRERDLQDRLGRRRANKPVEA
jgi:hypothetical protein